MTIQVKGAGLDGEGGRGAREVGSVFGMSFGGRAQRSC